MTAKKPIQKIEKSVSKEYKPVFETIVIVKKKTTDLNWVSLGRRFRKGINKVNIFSNNFLDKTRNKTSTIKSIPKNIWNKYTVWFDSKFNKETVNNEENR